jgi:hypothetical protein
MISSKVLNKHFQGMLDSFKQHENDKEDGELILCKAGLYSKRVKKYESMHQGKFIEKVVIKLTNSIECYTDGIQSNTHYGNADFKNGELDVSLKSSIRTKNTFIKKTGGVGACVKSKIFDASRKSIQPSDSKILLKQLLSTAGYEIPIMSYIFETETNKGVLFLTSLSEMARFKNNIEEEYYVAGLNENIEDLFHFNKSSHYLISQKDAYDTAKHYGRTFEFSINEEDADKYVKKHLKKKVDVLDEIR